MSSPNKSQQLYLPRRDFLAGSAAFTSTILLNSSLCAEEKKEEVVKNLGQKVGNFFTSLLKFGLENADKFIPFAAQADSSLVTLYKTWALLSGCYKSEADLGYLTYRYGSKSLGTQATVLSQYFLPDSQENQPAIQQRNKPVIRLGGTRAIFAPPSVVGMDAVLSPKPMANILLQKATEWFNRNPKVSKAQSIIAKYILPPLEIFIQLGGQPRRIPFSAQPNAIIGLNESPKLPSYDRLLALQAGVLHPDVNDSELGLLGQLLRACFESDVMLVEQAST